MTLVAPIRLQYDPKILWFDPVDLDIHADDPVIVETARGLEYGTLAADLTEVDDEVIADLKSPLKPVIRLATEEDEAQRLEMRRLSYEALPIFKEIARETNESMHPVMVEYLFDGSKAIFLFESEERNDFRELVRRLTSKLHIRVDMRQIGVRDGARIIGGLGHCGQELCCRRLGGEFCPVSIRMAKAQDLSLNPQQISGVCGRLMCCLRYEYETYKDFKSRAPKQNAQIETPEGTMRVCELDTPHEQVVLRNADGKRIRIPLAEFDEPEEGMNRPRSIGEAFYAYANEDHQIVNTASYGDTSTFTAEDKLAEGGQIHHNKVHRGSSSAEHAEDKRPGASFRRRRRSASGHKVETGEAAVSSERSELGKRSKQGVAAKSTDEGQSQGSSRRRRRRSSRGKDASSKQSSKRQNAAKGAQSGNAKANLSATSKGAASGKAEGQSRRQNAEKASAPTAHRRSRRRTHKTGGETSES